MSYADNIHLDAKETDNDVVFMHSVKNGPANKVTEFRWLN